MIRGLHHNPDIATAGQTDRAARAVLYRYDRGQLTGPDALTVLRALGLVDDGQGTETSGLGVRRGPARKTAARQGRDPKPLPDGPESPVQPPADA